MAEKIQYDVQVTGVETAASGFEKVGGSISKASTAGTSFRAQISGTSTALGGLVSALSAADPRIAQFTFALGSARSAVGGLVSVLGGPAGLLAGAAVGGAIAALAHFTRAQKEAEEQALRTANAIGKESEALRKFSRDVAAKYGAAKSDYQKIGEDILEMESKQRMAKRRGDHAAASRIGESIGEAKYQQELARFAAQQKADQAKQANDLDVLGGEGRLPGGGGSAARQRAFDDEMFLDMERGMVGREEGRAEAAAKMAEAERKARIESVQMEIEQTTDLWEFEAKERDRIDEERAEKERERIENTTKTIQQSVLNIGEFSAQAFAKGLSALVKGQKFAVKAVLEGIGDQMVAEGTHLLFKAAAAAFIPGMQVSAGPLAGIGAAEIAFGLGLGAATAGGGPSGGGGGGGLGVARPVVSVDQSRDDRPVIINLNMPTVLSPGPEDARRINDALRVGSQVYGQYGVSS